MLRTAGFVLLFLGFLLHHGEFYLNYKIGQGHMCLWCNEKGRRFQSCSAAQKHMIDKGHCKMFLEGDAIVEFADFYDYSSSYPSAEDANENEQDAGEVELDLTRLDDTGYELVLPSGAKVGHRSLVRYYRYVYETLSWGPV